MIEEKKENKLNVRSIKEKYKKRWLHFTKVSKNIIDS